MNMQVIGGLVRAVLGAVGGWLVANGYVDAESASEAATSASSVVGAAAVVATAAWSWWSKVKAKKEG